jgi:DNA invertase Pin-like site-specific DNA recombinase
VRVTINGVPHHATPEQVQKAFDLLPNSKATQTLLKALEPVQKGGRKPTWTDSQYFKTIELRDAGVTWDAIAAAVGLSRSTVIKIWNTREGK